MLYRLIVALLLAAFAVPSVAASPCHDVPMAMNGHAMPTDTHHDAAPAHSCIGCIPLADWMAARVFAPMLVVQPTPTPIVARLDLGHGWPPALPPPRIG